MIDVVINGKTYVPISYLLNDGWYPSCVPLPQLIDGLILEFKPSGSEEVIELYSKNGRWWGGTWSLSPSERTGSEDDQWRIKDATNVN